MWRTFWQAVGGGQGADGSQEPARQGPADVVPSLPPGSPLRRRCLVLPGKDGRVAWPPSLLPLNERFVRGSSSSALMVGQRRADDGTSPEGSKSCPSSFAYDAVRGWGEIASAT